MQAVIFRTQVICTFYDFVSENYFKKIQAGPIQSGQSGQILKRWKTRKGRNGRRNKMDKMSNRRAEERCGSQTNCEK